jgi:sigma-B regulation protein RsbU (phosphoserine phosphatase)
MRISFLRDFRDWLSIKGWYPGSMVGKYTVYLGLVDLVLWLLRHTVRLFKPHSDFASSTVYFLTVVLIVCALIWLFQWIRRTLMWRLRNRLLVTYAFIGFAPIVLLLAMFFFAAWLFVGQFAAYLATNDFKTEMHRLSSANNTIMGGAKVLARANKVSEGARDLVDREIGNRDFPMRHITLWYRGKGYVLQGKADDEPVAVPTYLQDGFEAMVVDNDHLYLRAVSRQKVGNDELVMVSSLPLQRELLADISQQLGSITIYPPVLSGTRNYKSNGISFNIDSDDKGKAASVVNTGQGDIGIVTAGAVPPASHAMDVNVFLTTFNVDVPLAFATIPTFINWTDGKSSTGLLVVDTRLSQLYRRLFEAVGDKAWIFLTVLGSIGVALLVIELVALFIGWRLTRTITRSVAELYVATEYVNKGDFHHRIHVKSRDQLAALESSFNSMTTSIEALILEQKEKQKLESELAIAQEVQALLFPREVNQAESLEMHGVCRPARTVSGDYYDFLQLGRNQIGLAVGDISGKGISAALLMAIVHSFVRAYTIEEAFTEAKVGAAVGKSSLALTQSGEHLPPATLLALLNEQLYRSTPASNLPPFLVCADGSHRKLGDGGMVVGLFGGVSYENDYVDLNTGDIIVAYSDGVTEPENEYGEFGEERLAQIVRENSTLPLPRIADAVITAVTDWIGGAEQPDDITVVLARAR